MNLLDSLKGLFTSEWVGQVSDALDETPGGISKALSGLVPTVLNCVVEKSADKGPLVLDLARQAEGAGILDNVGSMFGGQSAENFAGLSSSVLSGLFGNNFNSISSAISSFSGITNSSANSLLHAVAPVALGLIGKYTTANNLSANGLVSWLHGQKETINQSLPSGLGIGQLDERYNEPATKPADHVVATDPSKMPGWIMPLLVVLLGGLLVWYFLKGWNDPAEVALAPIQTEVAPAVPVDTVSYTVVLADGTALNAFKGGIEDQLVACITDPSCTPGKDRWFDFDNLNFEIGSAQITTASEVQVMNIAAILKAYPGLKIKIGGYTDKTGDTVTNRKLSQERADAVLSAVKKAGGNAAQLEGAEGYGSAFATVPADASDQERKADRRISISMRAK